MMTLALRPGAVMTEIAADDSGDWLLVFQQA